MNKPTDIIEKALENIGFDALNDLQKETLVKAKNASNLLILSQTGSGKTVAFLLPLLLQLK
jgi:superfamily II DNA/RNA helicase